MHWKLVADHILTVQSLELLASLLFLFIFIIGSQLIEVIGFLCPLSAGPNYSPVSGSQRSTLLSAPADAKIEPSGEKATYMTQPVWPVMV